MPLLRALSLATVAVAYNRTVSYVNQQVLTCAFKSQATVQALDDKLGLDIWDVREGEVVVRVTTPEQKKVVQEALECNVTIADLEQHVSSIEQQEKKKT